MEYDVLIVGCGLTGAVIARHLAEKCNKKVKILERRNHIAGNMYDYTDEHGILVQKYGPHTFHTKKKELYEFMCKYAKWEPYTLTCMAEIDGKATPTPFNFQTIDDFYSSDDAEDLKARIKAHYGDKATATVLEVLNCSDSVIREYAQFLYDKDYSLYSAKQWGISPTEIDPSIFKRVPLRFSYDIGYLGDPYEVMPKISFVDFFNNILNHPNIDIELGVEALEHIEINEEGTSILIDGNNCSIPIIYTGALDELFKGIDGYLPYRSLRFEMKYEDIDSKQGAPVVAYPQADGYTRITEFKKIPIQDVKGTTYAVEYPLKYNLEDNSEPYYPVLTDESQKQYRLYKLRADRITNLIYCGRLADFKYYNMDQALARALYICQKLFN
ncbi:UDP-galactopyranose mutase [Clostridium diolis]|uniref:UDP-galactopyranose mutase n=1 Tax=Clostridium diolis TaxID=223919 RepID=UPI000B403912|nr:UDP-galactopyranose mutase [Clostridium diolis]OVE67356.1 UDP-galactopyranose mutase [Clostridium diolis]